MTETLLQRFEHFAVATPSAPALLCGDETLSYAELNTRAERVAAWLQAEGRGRGDLVGLDAQVSSEFVVGMLGILKAGAAWVPLEPDSGSRRRDRVIHAAGLNLILDALTETAAIGAEFDGAYTPVAPAPADLCYVMFTSGSTGAPNGVPVTHANVAGLFSALQDDFDFSREDVWSSLHAPTFGFSIWEMWGALSQGAALALLPAHERMNPYLWSAQAARLNVSVLSLTPSGFRQLLAAGLTPAALAAVRLIVLSGEPVDPADIRRWHAQLGPVSPRLINTYALTEAAGRVCWHEFLHAEPVVADVIGRPADDVSLWLLDATAKPVASGETGEIYIGGPMLAAGYLNAPELTAERFVTLTLAGQSERLYKTGDRAKLSATGELVFAGRTDEQIKLRGHRIELAEIERALRSHSAVKDAAVVLQTEGAAPSLHAYTVPAEQQDSGVQFWPSLGEYQIYDDLLYDFMSADETRVASYRRAFARVAKDKVVLDIGTGKDAILARLAAAAGARHVYAVEVLEDACAAATALVKQLGLSDVITVLQGEMQSVDIPEAIEVCTQGIIGNIGSSDGIAPIWNSARSRFADGCVSVPAVCTTYIAPAELPAEARAAPAFGALAARYTQDIFATTGGEFDVRLCVRNFPRSNTLATAAVFETLDFATELSGEYVGSSSFAVEQDCCFDGLLLWTEIDNGADESVDFLEHQQAWLPVWFPLTDEPVAMCKGDRIEVSWRCETPVGQIFPDYFVDAVVSREGAADLRLAYATRHFEQQRGATALHRQLLAGLHQPHDDVRTWLRSQLPAYMQPSQWTELVALPLNSSAKLDRRLLQAPAPAVVSAVESDDPLVNAINRIWCDVLDRSALQNDEDFFTAGGDSILAVRLTTEVQRYLDDTVFLAALFDAPNVTCYCEWLREHHAEAVAKRLAGSAAEVDGAQALVAAGRDASPTPLSFPQQSLLFLHELYPDNTGANEQFLVRINGAVDIARLEAAWFALLENHDILRTQFRRGADATQQPVPVALCRERAPLLQVDLRALSPALASEKLRADARAALAQPFDLGCAPLLRIAAYTLPGAELALLITAHHIVADGMCVQLMRDELAHAYAGTAGAPEFQYADFARWQRTQLDAAGLEAGLLWWQAALEGHSGQSPSLVPTTADNGAEARFAFTIPAALADSLRVVAQDSGATPFMLLLAAWRAWLSRCLMEKDLLLGSPVTLRREEALATMLGCMVNNVVFRNPVDSQATFARLLEAERDSALAALSHSEVPFEKVVEAVQPERQLGRHPLFQLMFLFEDRTQPDLELAGLRFSADVLAVDRASYWDLELSVTDCGAGADMPAFIGVRRDIYDADALAWWPEGFISMLHAIAAEPNQALVDLPLLSAVQRHRVLVEWNNTSLPLPADTTLHGLVRAQAARTPAARAVVDQYEALTYAALLQRADSYAAALLARGVEAGDLIGLSLERGAHSIALQLAILRCGAGWLPLDPAYPPARLKLMRADAGPRLVVCDVSSPLLGDEHCIAVAELQNDSTTVTNAVFPDVAGEDVAYALYTSGSTGRPKGVLATHASAVSRCHWMWQSHAFAAQDVFGQRTSLNFVDSVWEIFGALGHGASVSVPPSQAEADPRAMHRWLQSAGVTHMALVPSVLTGLLDVCESDGVPETLHTLISSGETLLPELAARTLQLLPGCRLLNTYGTSETWDVSCYEVQPDSDARVVPIGRPVANASLCILDEALKPVPPGVEGELFAGGLGLAREYLGQPALTAEKFIDNPFAELVTARLYRTGDRARFRADGNVELLGRRDRQIKLRGIRIETGDIEAQVLALAEVAQCAVVLRQRPVDASEWLALYIVPAGTPPAPEALRNYLAEKLPRVMVPADIYVIEQLPLTPSGKLDVASLPVTDHAPRVMTQFEAPSGELEELLAEVWSTALEVDRVGRHDNFFALRGHSLLATRVIARLGEALELDIPLQCLFEAPTVAGLARGIEALSWAADQGAGDTGADREVLRL